MMSMPTNETVPVVQGDRDAAADMWLAAEGPGSPADWQAEWFRDGTGDYGPVVQAFARYRLSVIEECAGVADRRAAMIQSVSPAAASALLDALPDAIRALATEGKAAG